MAFSVRPGFQRTISVTFTKEDGSPGQVQGVPTWEVSDDTIATLVPAADGMSVVIQHNGGVGDTILTNRADGDLGIEESQLFPIVTSDTASMLAPLGAVGSAFGIGEEVAIP